MTEEITVQGMSRACYAGRCGDCPDDDQCSCGHHGATSAFCQYPHQSLVAASLCVEFRNPVTLEHYREHMCGVHRRMEHNHIVRSHVRVEDCPGGTHHADRLNHEIARHLYNQRRRK